MIMMIQRDALNPGVGVTLISRREGRGGEGVTAIGKVPHYQHRDCIMIMMTDTERCTQPGGGGDTRQQERGGGEGDSNRESPSLSTQRLYYDYDE